MRTTRWSARQRECRMRREIRRWSSEGCLFEGLEMIAGSSAEARLRDKLRKIEALFAGAATAGEKAAAAADAAADRIRAHLGILPAPKLRRKSDSRSRTAGRASSFIALCRRYRISPFRYRRMHRQTVIV